MPAGGEWPQRVETPPGLRFVDVAAGRYHSVALTDAGEVYTWGLNDVGQLGRQGTTVRCCPKPPLPPTAQSTNVPLKTCILYRRLYLLSHIPCANDRPCLAACADHPRDGAMSGLFGCRQLHM